MPAHQYCDLFYPLDWGSDWVYHKLGNAPVLRSGTGSWVLSGSSGVRHPLSPVIRLGLRNLRKKERNVIACVAVGCSGLQCDAVLCSVLQNVVVPCHPVVHYSNCVQNRVCCSVLQCVPLQCVVLQCVAVCCHPVIHYLQCVAVCCHPVIHHSSCICNCVCCSLLQCLATLGDKVVYHSNCAKLPASKFNI